MGVGGRWGGGWQVCVGVRGGEVGVLVGQCGLGYVGGTGLDSSQQLLIDVLTGENFKITQTLQ